MATTLGADLDESTRVEVGEGDRLTARLSSAWEIWGPNGGYLAAIALRAAATRAQIPQPVSFYCHFLASAAFDVVDLDVTVLRAGRRSEALAVHMTQDGKSVLHAMVRTGADGSGPHHQHADAPDVPKPDELATMEELIGAEAARHYPFWDNVERWPIAQELPGPGGDPVVRDWTRFRPTARFDDPFLDAARSLILLDTYGYPAAWQRYRDELPPAPNLDTAAWFHRPSPDSEWLLIDEQCMVGDRGLLGIGGRVWDTNGRLVASGGAQLLCL
jgi:acyl-CoA thioesterase-2